MADGGGYRQLQLNIKPGLLIDLFAGTPYFYAMDALSPMR